MGCAPSKPEILVQAKSQSRPQQNPPAPSKAQGVIDANDSQGVSVLLTLSDGKEGGDVLTLPASSDADSSSGIDLHVRLLSSSGKEGDPPDYIAKGLQALITTDALALEAIVLRAKVGVSNVDKQQQLTNMHVREELATASLAGSAEASQQPSSQQLCGLGTTSGT
jgi:hypothetical protein